MNEINELIQFIKAQMESDRQSLRDMRTELDKLRAAINDIQVKQADIRARVMIFAAAVSIVAGTLFNYFIKVIVTP